MPTLSLLAVSQKSSDESLNKGANPIPIQCFHECIFTRSVYLRLVSNASNPSIDTDDTRISTSGIHVRTTDDLDGEILHNRYFEGGASGGASGGECPGIVEHMFQLEDDAVPIEPAVPFLEHAGVKPVSCNVDTSVGVICSPADVGGNMRMPLNADVQNVLEAIFELRVSMKQELLDIKADLRRRYGMKASSIVSCSINKFCEQVFLLPLEIAQRAKDEFYTKLESDAATRDAAAHLLSAIDIEMSIDKFLHLRNQVCKNRRYFRQHIAGTDSFAIALRDLHLAGLDSDDRALLTRMHEYLWDLSGEF